MVYREIAGFRLQREDYDNVEQARVVTNKYRRQRMLPDYDFADFLRLLMRSGFAAWQDAFKHEHPSQEARLVITPDEFRQEVLGGAPVGRPIAQVLRG